MEALVMRYLVISDIFSVSVHTNRNGIIIKTAPITKRFLNQPLSNLIDWLVRIKKNPVLHNLGQTCHH
jgi:hypothetical protein